jgi:hypothetical protein
LWLSLLSALLWWLQLLLLSVVVIDIEGYDTYRDKQFIVINLINHNKEEKEKEKKIGEFFCLE